MLRIIYRIISAIYPERCGFCGKIIGPDKWICAECANEIEFADCSGDLPENLKGMCFDKVFYAGRYGGLARDGIIRLKRQRAFNVARYYCFSLCKSIIDSGCADDIDAVAYVPMSKRKKAVIGYDHAEIIARIVAQTLGKKLLCGGIVRKNTRKSQHSQRNNEDRRAFADSVYHVPKRRLNLKGQTILLCDDVITSGSSLSCCSDILKAQGADAVYAAALVSGRLTVKGDFHGQ